ncbi:MAG: alanine racemase [Lachnospiraceae bacterium]|jgi:diaminopimelate decarboxylase|nr:alanine racemase [Lachnospiraceae bacterium]
MALNDETLKLLAAGYGTPSFVFDETALYERMKAAKEIVGENVHLCYSMKANPFLVPAMTALTERVEVCSPGELAITEKLKTDPSRIVYSGVNKQPADIAEAISYGAGIFTAESTGQADLLEKGAAQAQRKIPVLLRLNAGSQFGMSRDDLLWMFAHSDRYPHLSFEGIHYFAGTQRRAPEKQRQELEMLRQLFSEIRSAYRVALPKLEYGPGLPYPYFEKDDRSDTLRPLKELAGDLVSAAMWADLTVEMGRFFVSECGYYLTRVDDLKEAEGKNYCILDGGMNHLTYFGQIMGMKIPVIRHLKFEPRGSGTSAWTLCGSLCTTADVLVREVPFTALSTGDVLAFCGIGAYSVTEGIYLFLSRTMPEILLYRGVKDGGPDVLKVRGFTETSSLNCPQYRTREQETS